MSSTPQQVINLGSAPNNGTGEGLREAFDNVNNNFANVWAAGPVNTRVIITNNWVSTTQTDLDLVIAGNGLGNIQMQTTALTQHMRPLSDSVYDLGTANLWYDSAWIRYLTTNQITTGNITVANIVKTTSVTYSTLTAVAGARAFISDANLVALNNFGVQVSGGGSNAVPVWSNGTNWYIG